MTKAQKTDQCTRTRPCREALLIYPVRRLVPVIAGLALALSACSSSSSSKASTAAPSATGAPATTTAPMSGSLNVFAGARLTGAFNAAKTTLTTANPGLNLTYTFGKADTLVARITQGAPADVFAAADSRVMRLAVDAGLVDAPVTFAKDKLEIAVAAGNPKRVTGLSDLTKPDVSVVSVDVGVPAGDYTRQVLASKHLTVTPKSLEADVKSALAKVASGEADATVAYVTDVMGAGSKVTGVTVSDADQPTITYPIAVVKTTKNRASAQAFVESAVLGDVQKALEAAGFLPPQ